MVDLTDDLRIIRFVDRPFTAGADHVTEDDFVTFRIPRKDLASGLEHIGRMQLDRRKNGRIKHTAGLERFRRTVGERLLCGHPGWPLLILCQEPADLFRFLENFTVLHTEDPEWMIMRDRLLLCDPKRIVAESAIHHEKVNIVFQMILLQDPQESPVAMRQTSRIFHDLDKPFLLQLFDQSQTPSGQHRFFRFPFEFPDLIAHRIQNDQRVLFECIRKTLHKDLKTLFHHEAGIRDIHRAVQTPGNVFFHKVSFLSGFKLFYGNKHASVRK